MQQLLLARAIKHADTHHTPSDTLESLCAVPALSKKGKIPPRYSLQKNLLFRLYTRSAPKEKSAPETNKRSPITGQLA